MARPAAAAAAQIRRQHDLVLGVHGSPIGRACHGRDRATTRQMLAGAPTPKCWEAENYNGSNLKATTRAEGKHLESIGGPGKLRAKLRGLIEAVPR